MQCRYYSTCLNNDKCFVCDNFRLLKEQKDKYRTKMNNKAKITAKKKDNLDDCSESWGNLEQLVADRLNAVPTKKQYINTEESRRQIRSGALWFAPGDVEDSVFLPECKERNTLTAKGEQTITIKRSWLEKVARESKLKNKYPIFIFRYKNDDIMYCINNFNILCDMATEIKFLKEENKSLNNEKDSLMSIIKQQEEEIVNLKNKLK